MDLQEQEEEEERDEMEVFDAEKRGDQYSFLPWPAGRPPHPAVSAPALGSWPPSPLGGGAVEAGPSTAAARKSPTPPAAAAGRGRRRQEGNGEAFP
jgi:hypothetical protein